MQSGRPRGQTNEYIQQMTDRYGRPLPGNAARKPGQAVRRDTARGSAPAARYPQGGQGGYNQPPRADRQPPDRRSLAVSYSSVRQGSGGQRVNVSPVNVRRPQPGQGGHSVPGGAYQYQGRPRTQPRPGAYPTQKRPIGGNHKVNRMVKGNKKSRRRTTIRDFVLGLVIGFAIFGPAAYFVCKTIIGIFA